MKIGILVTIISGFGKKGFYHSQEIGLGKKLAEMGHEVTVYKCLAKSKHEEDAVISERLQVRYFSIPAIGVHGYMRAGLIDKNLDALLVFSDTQIFTPHIYRYCRRHKIAFVPYIGIAHSAWHYKIMDALFSLGTLRIYKKIPVIAKSEGVRRELEALGVKDCSVAPVGLDPSALHTDFRANDRSKLRSEFGYTPGDVVVSFVGRLKVEKQPEEMLNLFSRIKSRKNFKMLMVGEGYLKEKLEAMVAELGIQDQVRMIERVPYEDMWKIHYIADYFVNLCTREIFGMALLEGIYYESSVVALHAPGPDDILTGTKAHVLCDSIAEVEKRLCGEYPGRELLQHDSDELLNRFSWKHCAEKLVEIASDSGRKG